MKNWVEFLEDQSCGDCVESHFTPGCEVQACEDVVCAIDPFCCNVFWDGICVGEAIDLCVPDICIALPASASVPLEFGPDREPQEPAEPVSKDPNYVPKEDR